MEDLNNGISYDRFRSNLSKFLEQESASKESDEKKTPKTLLVLVLSGSFNPVHLSHVQSFEAAKDALEKDPKFKVIAGFISTSSDSHVTSKLGQDAMKLEARNKMCELAVADSNWITMCGWGWASARRVCDKVHRTVVERVLPKYFKNLDTSRIECVEICGADHAAKCHFWEFENLMVCLGRKGSTTEVKRMMAEAQKRHQRDLSKTFLLVEDERVVDISSTGVRRCLQTQQFDEMVKNKWLHPDVAKYLKEQGLNAYISKKAYFKQKTTRGTRFSIDSDT